VRVASPGGVEVEAVIDRGGPWIDLRHARLRANGRADLFDPTAAELDEGAGVDVAELLRASALSRSARGRRSSVTMAEHATASARAWSPAAAWPPSWPTSATRVAPVARDIIA
jgi:hypothetical protein